MAGLKLKKGDRVQVLQGKDRGKQGVILKVLPSERKVIVEGVNTVKRHTKPRMATAETGNGMSLSMMPPCWKAPCGTSS